MFGVCFFRSMFCFFYALGCRNLLDEFKFVSWGLGESYQNRRARALLGVFFKAFQKSYKYISMIILVKNGAVQRCSRTPYGSNVFDFWQQFISCFLHRVQVLKHL